MTPIKTGRDVPMAVSKICVGGKIMYTNNKISLKLISKARSEISSDCVL